MLGLMGMSVVNANQGVTVTNDTGLDIIVRQANIEDSDRVLIANAATQVVPVSEGADLWITVVGIKVTNITCKIPAARQLVVKKNCEQRGNFICNS